MQPFLQNFVRIRPYGKVPTADLKEDKPGIADEVALADLS